MKLYICFLIFNCCTKNGCQLVFRFTSHCLEKAIPVFLYFAYFLERIFGIEHIIFVYFIEKHAFFA